MAKESDQNAIADLNGRVNTLESKADQTNGYLQGVVESNEKLIKLLSRSLYILAFIAIVLLFALVYGAIGKEGLHSVRESLPKMPTAAWAIPAHNDFDRWMALPRQGAHPTAV